jgi:uncharacterized protein YqhQ
MAKREERREKREERRKRKEKESDAGSLIVARFSIIGFIMHRYVFLLSPRMAIACVSRKMKNWEMIDS